jgi:membrane associated rhomboid family serine protease
MTQASVGFHCPECARSGAQKVIRARDLSQASTPVTVALIVLNVGAFLVQNLVVGNPPASLENWGLLYGPLVESGEWWRIVTSGFLHSGLLHIGFNMFTLWIFGSNLERELGPVRFGLAYLAGLLGGSMAVIVFNFNSHSLGASGAVLGVAGALAAVLWSRGIAMTQTSLGGIFILNLALPLLAPRISFWGHLGGVAAGFAAGWLLSWLPDRFNQPIGVAVGATAALCAALFGLALVGPSALGI